MSTQPQFVASYRNTYTQYVNAGAKAQVIWQAGSAGSRIHAIRATQDDTGTGVLSLYRGRILTDNALPFPNARRPVVGKAPILAATKTTNDHLDRTNGSFVQDGWVAGMNCAILDSTDNPQNQVIAHVTTVVAATLTYTGTPLNATAATMAASTVLALVNLLDAATLVASAGTSGVPGMNLFSTTNDPSLLAAPDGFLILGPYELLVVNLATLPAANTSVNVTVDGGEYA
jgi:hypothetical protein